MRICRKFAAFLLVFALLLPVCTADAGASVDDSVDIIAGKSAEEIKASWQDDINSFLEQRKPYLLYD